MRWAYLALIVWQPVWHGYFEGRISLGLLLMLPLLLACLSVFRGGRRGRAIGGFVVLLYVVIGFTEIWANVDERWLAAIQLTLCVGYLLPLMKHGWIMRKLEKKGKTKS